jgi:ABC-type Fe3+ transport system substrate-binding protein
VIAAAKAEGKLDLRSTNTILGGPQGAKIAQEAIQRMFGVDLAVSWSPGPAFGPLAAIFYQEMQAGQPASGDVYFTTAIQLSPYLEKGLFRPVDWAKLMPQRIAPDLVEADGRALRVLAVFPGILYNLKAAPWVAAIASAADLLKPDYKGKFYTTPFLAGFDVALADEMWGIARTQDYVRRLSAQVGGLIGCEGIDRIASGEVPALALDCSGASPNKLDYRGKDILANHILPDLAQRRYNYLTILSHAPHPNAAILYTLFIASPEGQERIMWNTFGADLDSFPEAHVLPEVASLQAKGVKFVDVTVAWWRSHPAIEKANLDLVKIVRER